jgi:hypothetical protein
VLQFREQLEVPFLDRPIGVPEEIVMKPSQELLDGLDRALEGLGRRVLRGLVGRLGLPRVRHPGHFSLGARGSGR